MSTLIAYARGGGMENATAETWTFVNSKMILTILLVKSGSRVSAEISVGVPVGVEEQCINHKFLSLLFYNSFLQGKSDMV